jgi:hypothetical protein
MVGTYRAWAFASAGAAAENRTVGGSGPNLDLERVFTTIPAGTPKTGSPARNSAVSAPKTTSGQRRTFAAATATKISSGLKAVHSVVVM